MEQLLVAVDAYCERIGPGLWAEPVNAVTNLAFIAAGLWGVARARRNDAGGWATGLALLVLAIGVGSGLFHTFANPLTAIADTAPIAAFTLLYTWYALRFFLGVGAAVAAGITAAWYVGLIVAMALAVPELAAATNGSSAYFPALAALLAFGALMAVRGHPAGRTNLIAGAIFALSLTFRSIDIALCDSVPLGAHFLWHLLNATVLATILYAVTMGADKAAARPGG